MNKYTRFGILCLACIAFAGCFSADKKHAEEPSTVPVPATKPSGGKPPSHMPSCDIPEGEPDARNAKLTVAFISHTYYVNRHSDIQKILIDDINAAKPKYLFALGDVVLLNTDELWQATLQFFSQFNAPVYYAPGNNDIFNFLYVEGLGSDKQYPQWRQEYIDRVGYAHKMVADPKADFLLINSNDPFFKIQPFLDSSLQAANPNTPTVLLTHHRIWLERYQNNWVHWYFKSATQKQFQPYIPRFSQIVVGDLWGKMEHLDITGTPTTMVGMGNNDKPVFWVLATLEADGEFHFEQKTIPLAHDHPYYRK